MSVITDLKSLAQEWYKLRAERKIEEPFVARRFLRESQIGSVLTHLVQFEAELPKSVPYFWSDVKEHARHEREMLRYKLRKEDINTLSFRATDNYMDELKRFATKARTRYEASEHEWNDALNNDQTIESYLVLHDKLWTDFAKNISLFWVQEVTPYLETLVLLADEIPDSFIQKKLQLNSVEVLEFVNKKNAANREAFWNK